MPGIFTTMGGFDCGKESALYGETEVLMASSSVPAGTTNQGELIWLLQSKFQPNGQTEFWF
jgi:hypothetical protein